MTATAPAAFMVAYRDRPASALLAEPGTLAVFSFADHALDGSDPRCLQVLQPALEANPPLECWSVASTVRCGRDDDLRWSAGGGWRFAAVEVVETAAGGIEAACEHAYERLLAHVAASAEPNLQRIWNYLDAINSGDGDAERYRLFCSARARRMTMHGVHRYPAATAIGHHGPRRLQVYALSCAQAGTALENPRQVSAWEYPRQFGPTAPSFARAMQLPQGGLAISGTAAVIGFASHHAGDVTAQANEAVANLHALLQRAALPAFDASSPLKVYVRHPEDAPTVRAVLAQQLDPAVPCVLLHGDICRSELLVEIDGWRFTNPSQGKPAATPAGFVRTR